MSGYWWTGRFSYTCENCQVFLSYLDNVVSGCEDVLVDIYTASGTIYELDGNSYPEYQANTGDHRALVKIWIPDGCDASNITPSVDYIPCPGQINTVITTPDCSQRPGDECIIPVEIECEEGYVDTYYSMDENGVIYYPELLDDFDGSYIWVYYNEDDGTIEYWIPKSIQEDSRWKICYTVVCPAQPHLGYSEDYTLTNCTDWITVAGDDGDFGGVNCGCTLEGPAAVVKGSDWVGTVEFQGPWMGAFGCQNFIFDAGFLVGGTGLSISDSGSTITVSMSDEDAACESSNPFQVYTTTGNLIVCDGPSVEITGCVECCEDFNVTGASTVNPGAVWTGTISPSCPGSTCEVSSNSGCDLGCAINEAGSQVTVGVGSEDCGGFTVTVEGPNGSCDAVSDSISVRINNTGQGGTWVEQSNCNYYDVGPAKHCNAPFNGACYKHGVTINGSCTVGDTKYNYSYQNCSTSLPGFGCLTGCPISECPGSCAAPPCANPPQNTRPCLCTGAGKSGYFWSVRVFLWTCTC